MKKTCLLFLLISSMAFSQKITTDAKQLPALLCKTWKADYAMMNNLKVQKMPEAMEMQIQFNKDNTYQVVDKTKTTRKGIWKYDSKNKCIHMAIDGIENAKLIALSKNEMVMTLVSKAKNEKDLPKIKVYFKPKA